VTSGQDTEAPRVEVGHHAIGRMLRNPAVPPSWWPEFERQLASYVAERETEKGGPAVPHKSRHNSRVTAF
jgi:hypothetical protein